MYGFGVARQALVAVLRAVREDLPIGLRAAGAVRQSVVDCADCDLRRDALRVDAPQGAVARAVATVICKGLRRCARMSWRRWRSV